MCECGCSTGNPTYRLPISKSACYTIELYRGCDYCSAAPSVIVRRVERTSGPWDDVQGSPVFPLAKIDDYAEGAIQCGLDPDEFRKQGAAAITGTTTEVDGVLAEIIAEDLWKACLRTRPKVINYKESQ